ncbi:hypothetical protein E4U42_005665 [Claviceps africana]|uniref:Uncharacterized protein n=1 Tax=Claviceps africana TaxID=83212 RepID=A0A8K0NH78_9HYPO|nr:hypothetical protein E4U42_005665 [Claviceps africana]
MPVNSGSGLWRYSWQIPMSHRSRQHPSKHGLQGLSSCFEWVDIAFHSHFVIHDGYKEPHRGDPHTTVTFLGRPPSFTAHKRQSENDCDSVLQSLSFGLRVASNSQLAISPSRVARIPVTFATHDANQFPD